jgi:AbrB family looped-hinge helix DNA binding protein
MWRKRMPDRQLVRIKQKGQLTLPASLLRELGLKEGDYVEVTKNTHGQLVITPQEVLAARALDELGAILKEKGITLDDWIESAREVRGDIQT